MNTPFEELESPYLDGELEFAVPVDELSHGLQGLIGESPFAKYSDGEAPTVPEASLYERLGGVFAIAAVIDRFSDALVQNPIVGRQSKNPALREWHTNNLGRLPGLKFMRTLWVCAATGGPFDFFATRPGRTALGLEEAHRRLRISPEQFDAAAGELARTLDAFDVPEREKQEVLGAFAAHKDEVTDGYRAIATDRAFAPTDEAESFAGWNDLQEERETYDSGEIDEAGDPEREWEDDQVDHLPLQESLDYVDEAPSDEAFDEEALADLPESTQELYGEEPEEEEESFYDHATSPEEAPFDPEEAGFEREEELDDLSEVAEYPQEGAGLDEELFIEPEEALDLEQQIDPALGQTIYLPIQLNKTVRARVGVFIPRGIQPTANLDLIVYFHGHIVSGCKTYPSEFNKKGIEYYWQTPLFKCLREDLAASGQRAILIAPTFIPIFASKKNHPRDYGDLNQPGKFDFLINAALTQLKKSGMLPADAQVRRVVLSGHSGGGLPMQAILDTQNLLKQKIAECWGFECLYFRTSAWERWLRASPSRHFRHYRRPGKFHDPTTTLQNFANFIDVNDGTDHCRIVKEKWRQAIDSSRVFHGVAGSPAGEIAPTSSTTSGAMSTLFSLLAGLPGLATLPLAFTTALLQGFRDENHLTNLVFLARHPELGGRKLTRGDPQFLKDEWLSIQKTVVRPALRRLKEAAAKPSADAASQRSAAAPPTRAAVAGWRTSDATSEYALTQEQRKTLAGQTAAERARDLAAFDKMTRTRLATLKRAEKKGTLRRGEAQELAALRALQARVDAAQAALKRLDVEEVLAGGGYTVAEWYGQVQRGSLLGIPLRVHRALAERLTRAEAAVVGDPAVNPDKLNAAALGAKLKMYPSTSDMRPPKAATGGTKLSMHTFGLAVDLNYTGNPFVGNAGKLVPEIVQRATGLVLGTRIDLLTHIGEAREAYDTLAKASAALKTYLAYRDSANLKELTAKVGARSRTEGEPADVPGWLAQIERDRTRLLGAPDFKKHKSAEEGFIDLDKAVVLALTGAGLTWGGTYPRAKDIMHFDLRQGDGAKVQAARMSHRGNV